MLQYGGRRAAAGFRAGRSTIDHLCTITQVIEKKIRLGQEMRDLEKAYSTEKVMGGP